MTYAWHVTGKYNIKGAQNIIWRIYLRNRSAQLQLCVKKKIKKIRGTTVSLYDQNPAITRQKNPEERRKLMMKLRKDMKPTDGQTELQPLQQPLHAENESLEPPSTPQTININNEDIVDLAPTTTTTLPERDTTLNQESNGTPERKSRPEFKVSQMKNRATRSGTVPTRYTEHRSESCSPKRNLTIEGLLRKGKRPP